MRVAMRVRRGRCLLVTADPAQGGSRARNQLTAWWIIGGEEESWYCLTASTGDVRRIHSLAPDAVRLSCARNKATFGLHGLDTVAASLAWLSVCLSFSLKCRWCASSSPVYVMDLPRHEICRLSRGANARRSAPDRWHDISFG